MSADVSFDRALAAVADGVSIDWDAVERLARDPAERDRVRCLRLLGEIGELHRGTADPLQGAADPRPGAATRDLPPPQPIRIAGAAPAGVAPPPARPPARPPAPPKAPPKSPDALSSLTETREDAMGPVNLPGWGRFRLVEKVGTGGFGQVYRAWDADLEREVAIKILHEHIADDRARDRLRREGRALASIDQANVVQVLGIEVHEGRAALCMEFVRGDTLDEIVRVRGPYGWREATLIGEDVCRALSAVHRAGYLHRDVKSKNVMRAQNGRIVLMDFGTGRREQADRAPSGDLTGTPLYMAPEVLAGGNASMRSDVYSVGVLLFYLVTAGYPVHAKTTRDLKTAHRSGRRRLLSECRSDLSSGFVRVVDKALAPNPDDRYPNAGALLDALTRALGKEETHPPLPVWRRLAAGALVAVLAVIALGTLTTAAFNVTVGRAEFAAETFWYRARMGLKLSMMPLFVLVIAWLVQAMVAALWRVALGVSARVRALDERRRERAAHMTRDPSVLASAVLLGSALALVGAWMYFWPLLTAMTSFVRFAPADVVAILGPDHRPHHSLYNFTFSLMAVLTAAAWLWVARAAAAHQVSLARGIVASGVVVVCLQLASLGIAYRTLIQNKLPAWALNGEVCYAMGERDERLLLFCPGRATDRNQVVRRGDQGLVDLHREESLFTGIGGRIGERAP